MMKSGEQDFYNLSPDHQEYPYKVLKHYKVWNLRNILTKLYVKFVKKDSTIERGIQCGITLDKKVFLDIVEEFFGKHKGNDVSIKEINHESF